MEAIDALKLNFDEQSLILLNICLAIIMFGIALDINTSDFKELYKNPRSAIIGLIAQFFALPFLTFLLILWLKPQASIALGMILVAACPGGNISNFMSHLSGANTALSVGLTSVSTMLSLFMTPINFQFYGSLIDSTDTILQEIHLSYSSVFETVLTIIVVPLLLGIWTRRTKPILSQKLSPLFRVGSILIFIAFVIIAFSKNLEIFLQYIQYVALLVLAHNALALATGYSLGKLSRLPSRDVRTLTIETGIQNSGLGLVLIFAFFKGIGGMALVAAWWGIWHIISGLGFAFFWSLKSKNLD